MLFSFHISYSTCRTCTEQPWWCPVFRPTQSLKSKGWLYWPRVPVMVHFIRCDDPSDQRRHPSTLAQMYSYVVEVAIQFVPQVFPRASYRWHMPVCRNDRTRDYQPEIVDSWVRSKCCEDRRYIKDVCEGFWRREALGDYSTTSKRHTDWNVANVQGIDLVCPCMIYYEEKCLWMLTKL